MPSWAFLLPAAWFIGLKAVAVASRASAPIGECLAYVLPDAVVGFGVLAVASCMYARERGIRRLVSALLCLLAVLLQTVCFVVLMRKGSPLDSELLVYTWRDFGNLHDALQAEARWFDPVLVVALLLACLPFLMRRLPRTRALWTSVALAAVSLPCAYMAVPTRPVHPVLAHALVRPLLWGASSGPVEQDVGLFELMPDPASLVKTWERRDANAERPNVILIVLESARASSTTPYNPRLATTPFLAELGKKSLVFERGYCLLSHSQKSCVTMFTGHPCELQQEIREPGRLPAAGFPERLRALGYRTGFVEPSTEKFENRRLLLDDLGFDDYISAEDIDSPLEKPGYFGYEDRALIKPAVRWLEENRSQPHHLTLWTLTAHHPYETPSSFGRRSFEVADWPPYREGYERYLNSLAYTDEMLRELFTELRRRRLLDNTVVVIVGDHGEGFEEHGRRGHGDIPWEEGVHVPLIVHGPSHLVGSPRRVGGLRQLQDIAATVADLVGVPGQRKPRSPLFGVSLLAPPDPDRTVYLFSWFNNSSMGSLKGNTKHIYFPRLQRHELFDLATDALERKDLGATLEEAAMTAKRRELMAYLGAVNTWWLAADAAEIDRMQRTELPPMLEPRSIDFGNARLVGMDAPEGIVHGAHMSLTLAFDVRDKLASGQELQLYAVVGESSRPVKTVRDLNRLPPASWQIGHKIVIPAWVDLRKFGPGSVRIDLKIGGVRKPLHELRIKKRGR
ncbi:MAG: hypothetical protein CMJ85_10405 [Planctomycetes bacterium]|nr:hypothetical protein [Planctomycetota bacterium]